MGNEAELKKSTEKPMKHRVSKTIPNLDCDMRKIIWEAYDQPSKEGGEIMMEVVNTPQGPMEMPKTVLNDLHRRKRNVVWEILEMDLVNEYFTTEFRTKVFALAQDAMAQGLTAMDIPLEIQSGPDWDCEMPYEIWMAIKTRLLSLETDTSKPGQIRFMRARNRFCLTEDVDLKAEMNELFGVEDIPADADILPVEEEPANGSEQVEAEVEEPAEA